MVRKGFWVYLACTIPVTLLVLPYGWVLLKENGSLVEQAALRGSSTSDFFKLGQQDLDILQEPQQR